MITFSCSYGEQHWATFFGLELTDKDSIESSAKSQTDYSEFTNFLSLHSMNSDWLLSSPQALATKTSDSLLASEAIVAADSDTHLSIQSSPNLQTDATCFISWRLQWENFSAYEPR